MAGVSDDHALNSTMTSATQEPPQTPKSLDQRNHVVPAVIVIEDSPMKEHGQACSQKPVCTPVRNQVKKTADEVSQDPFQTPDRKPTIPFKSPDTPRKTKDMNKPSGNSEVSAFSKSSSDSIDYSSNTSCISAEEGPRLRLGQSGMKQNVDDGDFTPERRIQWKELLGEPVSPNSGNGQKKIVSKSSQSSRVHPFFRPTSQ